MSRIAAVIAAGVAFGAVPAFAQNVSVETPDVLRGRAEVETDTRYAHNVSGSDNAWAHQLVVAYAPFENLRLGAGVIATDPVGSGARADAYLAEIRFEGPRPSWMPIEWGIIGTYIGGGPEGVNDGYIVRALASKEIGAVEIVANLDISGELGGGRSDDAAFDLLLEGRLPITERFIAAITYAGQLGDTDDFGALGSLGQYLGPTVYASWPVPLGRSAIGIEGGVLLGLTEESADAIGKVNLTWATQF